MELREELRDTSKIQHWAGKYPVDYDICIENLVPEVKERGYLTKCDLIKVSEWLSKRKISLVKAICPDFVEEMTHSALTPVTPITERDRINYLRRLSGVGRERASAILHWFHEDRYPIWNYYAIWSVKLDKSQYKNNFERWKAYVEFCRDTADEYEVCMRTLDRALKKYGQANMPSSC